MPVCRQYLQLRYSAPSFCTTYSSARCNFVFFAVAIDVVDASFNINLQSFLAYNKQVSKQLNRSDENEMKWKCEKRWNDDDDGVERDELRVGGYRRYWIRCCIYVSVDAGAMLSRRRWIDCMHECTRRNSCTYLLLHICAWAPKHMQHI